MYKLLLTALAFLSLCVSSCTKNDEAFTVRAYTSNPNLPQLFIVKGNSNKGEVKYRGELPTAGDDSLTTEITFDRHYRIEAADAHGNIVATTAFTLKEDGTWTSSGGGYLWYNIHEVGPRELAIDYVGQIK
jgi:hypothetical protein